MAASGLLLSCSRVVSASSACCRCISPTAGRQLATTWKRFYCSMDDKRSFPDNLRYTSSHEWVQRLDQETASIGITSFAQAELGEVVFVEVDADDAVQNAGDRFGCLEAVKTVSDLLMPVAGSVLETNEKLQSNPQLINKDPYGDGWIAKIKLATSDDDQFNRLMSSSDYQKTIA